MLSVVLLKSLRKHSRETAFDRRKTFTAFDRNKTFTAFDRRKTFTAFDRRKTFTAFDRRKTFGFQFSSVPQFEPNRFGR